MVLQGLHRYWPPLRDLVAQLELDLGHPCQANAYLTPPGAQGFAVHSDSHDVFVFQTHGHKQWEVHTEGRVEDVLLEPGLSMYLPTGTPHAARAQDAASLHVTLGINQLTWRRVVEHTVLDVAGRGPRHARARRLARRPRAARRRAARPPGPGRRRRTRASTPTASTRQRAERFLASRGTRLPGGLRDVLAVRELTDTSPLARRPGHPCVLVDAEGPDGPVLRVLLGDRHLDVPAAAARRARGGAGAAPRWSPADLADHLDPESRLVLCRRLVREGLLRVTG